MKEWTLWLLESLLYFWIVVECILLLLHCMGTAIDPHVTRSTSREWGWFAGVCEEDILHFCWSVFLCWLSCVHLFYHYGHSWSISGRCGSVLSHLLCLFRCTCFWMVLIRLRGHMRHRFEIPGSFCIDFCILYCCGLCSTIQMARHTHDENE